MWRGPPPTRPAWARHRLKVVSNVIFVLYSSVAGATLSERAKQPLRKSRNPHVKRQNSELIFVFAPAPLRPCETSKVLTTRLGWPA